MNKILKFVASISIESNHVFVVLEKWASVGHCEQSDLKLFGLVVQFGLDIHTYGAGALVQDGEERFVVEKSGHGDSLFLSAWKHVVPVINRVESSFSALNVVKPDSHKEFPQVVIVDIFLGHFRLRVGINDLVPESSWWKVGSLWDVEQFIHVGSSHHTAGQWPKSTQYSEKWALSAAVRSSDNCVHASLDLKTHLLN